jgi:pilus assembly protein CpaF
MYLKIFEFNCKQPTYQWLDADKTSWTIGRDAGTCDIVISPKSSQVSRRHATLMLEDGQYALANHGTYGIFIDGMKIKDKYTIKPGQLFILGESEHGGYCRMMLTETQDEESEAEPEEEDTGGATLMRPEHAKGVETIDPSASFSPSNDLFQANVAANSLYSDDVMAFKKEIHDQIVTEMHLVETLGNKAKNVETERRIKQKLDAILRERSSQVRHWRLSLTEVKDDIFNNIMRLGPITPLLDDKSIDEVMVNGHDMVFVERNGIIEQRDVRFYDDRHLISIIQRIVEKVGRHIDEASPMVDARLADGSRVNAIIPPLAIDGPSLTIRKFKNYAMTTEDLIRYGTLTPEMAAFLRTAVESRQNIIISGGTGSGKTTLLNVLGEFIPQNERLVIIEDSAELRLRHIDKVRLEARPANIEGHGRITIRDLLVNSLRMRPDRIIIGECRSGEALDMLQAMNTGHDGSLTTVHANSPRDALSRLENMVLMAGYDLPVSAIREQAASAINLVIQQNRLIDGSRKIVNISEITGRDGNVVSMQDIFVFEEEGVSPKGQVIGHFTATGNIPQFVEQLRRRGNRNLNLSIFAKGRYLTDGRS